MMGSLNVVRGAVAFGSLFTLVAMGACSSSGTTPGADPDGGGGDTTDAAGPGVSDASHAVDGGNCGRNTTPCADGAKCAGAPDCKGGICRNNVCSSPSPADGVKDGDETDVDCGGSKAPACADGKQCLIGADCTASVCAGGICRAPTCTDKAQNGAETDVDCGGGKCGPCADGAGCKSGATDCVSLVCAANKCAAPGCNDGVKNGTETDKDCGGTCALKCETNQGCMSNMDCIEGPCDAAGTKKCLLPTSADGLTDGNETDVDCGSGGPGMTDTKAPKCKEGKSCVLGADCTTNGCASKKCVLPSCATGETAGINTCGAGETGDAAAVHESCCRSLPLPSRTTRRLDKYEITSGRMRTFLATVGADVRTWVANYVVAHPTSQLANLVNLSPQVGNFFPAQDRFVNLSLTAHMSHDIDNYSGERGCYNGYDPNVAGSGNYSANTYWMDNAHYGDYGIQPRTLPRVSSDEKSLNCTMAIMDAAFCAWDHDGELALLADYYDVWLGPQPWDAANICPTGSAMGGAGQGPSGSLPCNHYNWCNGPYKNGGWTCENTNDASLTGEAGVFYEWPRNTDRSRDNEPLIGAPGRFTKDASKIQSGGESWYDLWGNMAEYTGDWKASANDFCDFSAAPANGASTCTRANRNAGDIGTHYVNVPTAGIIGVSWEGHQYNRGGNGYAVTFQYGKFGARCARPVE